MAKAIKCSLLLGFLILYQLWIGEFVRSRNWVRAWRDANTSGQGRSMMRHER
jgi:hypothetical protein